MISDDALRQEIEAMAPWHHDVVLRDGLSTAAQKNTDATGQIIQNFSSSASFDRSTQNLFPEGMQGRSFLDCACNCGGYSFAAKDRGAGRVYGFDVRDHWINQAKFIQENRDADSSDMRFEVAKLDALAQHDAMYDVTWFSGIFYHLPDPVAGLKLAADRTKELLFLNTAYHPNAPEDPEVPALIYKQEGTQQLMSGVDGPSWLPSGPLVLTRLLNWLGFPETKVYYWKSPPTQDDGQSVPGRMGIVAARDPGRLEGVTEVTQPTGTYKRNRTVFASKAAPPAATSPAPAHRPERWEDDLSVNALDTHPFQNGAPVSDWPKEAFKVVSSGRAPACLQQLPLMELAAKDTLPIPNSQDREGYAVGYDEWYWLSGLRDYHLAMQALRDHGAGGDRLLEIGCASGRVLRHFAMQSEFSELWGTDINHRHIRWLSDHMPPKVKPLTMPALPGLPVEDNYFDVVTAFSVFTHIDVFETAFLADIRRVLKPGGIAYLTAHTETTWDDMRESLGTGEQGLAKRMVKVDPGLEQTIQNPMPKGRTQYRHTQKGPYRGQVFHSTDYIENVWGRFFTIEQIIPFGHEKQTVIIARK